LGRCNWNNSINKEKIKMALTNEYETQQGITCDEAYAVIDSIRYFKDRKKVSFNLSIYYNEEAKEENKQPIKVNSYVVMNEDLPVEEGTENPVESKTDFDDYFNIAEFSDTNMVQQAYLFLKTVDEFTSWEDC
jgi:hypothetical protein